jgi:hypothetical protein
MRFYNTDIPYDFAYCKEWNTETQSCDELFYLGTGPVLTNPDYNYLPDDNGVDFSADLIWADGAWASGGLPDPWYYSFSPMAYLLWEMIRGDYPDNPEGILGAASSPLRLFFGVYMGAETVAYSAPVGYGSYEGLHHVDGAHSVGTTAHEFGHRLHQTGVLEPPGNDDKPTPYLIEGIGDAMAMIYAQRYQADPAAPEYYCSDRNGYLYGALPDPGVAHPCFNVWREEPSPSFYHQNIRVQPIGKYTRCSAIEALEFGDDQADLPENIWRSLRNPKERNHGHGRGPLTYDQMLNDGSKNFVRGVLEDWATGGADESYFNEYCNDQHDFEALCVCGANFGVGHANMGPHNRFFYDLSGLDDAAFPLAEGDPAAAAWKQKQLLDAIYAEDIPSYLDWAERVTDIASGAVPVGGLTEQQATNIKRSLRETKIFGSAGRIDGANHSDIEAIAHWGNVDDQRLYVFYREPEEAGGPSDDPERYPRHLKYTVLDLDGAGAAWRADCEMPQVDVPDLALQPALSGFAPTAVTLGEAIWVAWSQYDQPAAGELGQSFGHLAHATLYPHLSSDPCGSWSGVDIDFAREVHGSPRATVINRGSIYIAELPPIFQDPQPDWWDEVDRAFWFDMFRPVSGTTLEMLATMGFEPDVPMDQVWRGHPGYAPSMAALLAEVATGYPEREGLVHLHGAVQALVGTNELGVGTRPPSDHFLAPVRADVEPSLRSLALDQGLRKAVSGYADIVDEASVLLPNAVSSVTEPPAPEPRPPVALDLKYIAGLGDKAGKFVLALDVMTAAVSFLGEDHDPADGTRDVVVRQYGVTADPFTPVDTIIGRARFAPGLTTLGQNVFQDDEHHGLIWMTTTYRDNVVACTDFVYDGMTAARDGALSCKVYRNGNISKWGEQRWFASPVEGMGPEVDITASPRAINIGDVAFIFFRGQGGTMSYVAFGGADLTPVTYNSLLFGLEFPTDEGGPRRWVTRIDTELTLPDLPEKQGVSWPIAPGAPFALPHGGMGYAGRPSGNDHVKIYTRGMGLAW